MVVMVTVLVVTDMMVAVMVAVVVRSLVSSTVMTDSLSTVEVTVVMTGEGTQPLIGFLVSPALDRSVPALLLSWYSPVTETETVTVWAAQADEVADVEPAGPELVVVLDDSDVDAPPVLALPSKQWQALLMRDTAVQRAVPHAVKKDGASGTAVTVVASHDEQRLEALEESRGFSSARRQLSALHPAA